MLNGTGFRPGASFFVYDKRQSVVVQDGSSLTHTPPPNPKLRPCVEIGDMVLTFAVASPTEARLTLELRNTTNRGLQEPYTEIQLVTVVNPDGAYAPYAKMHFVVAPGAPTAAKARRKAR